MDKYRFKQLLESQMGNVKPLINEMETLLKPKFDNEKTWLRNNGWSFRNEPGYDLAVQKLGPKEYRKNQGGGMVPTGRNFNYNVTVEKGKKDMYFSVYLGVMEVEKRLLKRFKTEKEFIDEINKFIKEIMSSKNIQYYINPK